MRLTKAALESVDLEPLRPYVASPEEFFGRREHYRLLAYLSTLVPDDGEKRIIDIGTHLGDSAVALSYAGREVTSFDVVNKIGGRPTPENVTYEKVDLFDADNREWFRDYLLESTLILIDIDPHEGTRERGLVEWLRANDYSGTIVLDDIWYFKAMRDELWYRIEPRFKADATSLGHWSGTGIISFKERVEVENARDTSNWTLVTGYFDLTKASDANDAIRARPPQHYIDQHAQSTLSLDNNLVVFCDPDLEQKIWSMRPSWLHERTRVIPRSFEEFPLTRYRAQIIANRGGVSGCAADPRNTASYYLFCMARYAMLKDTIEENPFESSHFAWINICIERMGFNNLVHLDEALGLNRNRFSTCWIDYISKKVVENSAQYFGREGCRTCAAACSMCSGFFTGNAEHMHEACDRIEKAFLRCLNAGFGHADEQLYPIVYFERPALFDWYIGDYTEMITNYAGVYEHPERPIQNLIRHSFAADDLDVCRRACDILLESYATRKCALSADQYAEIADTRGACD